MDDKRLLPRITLQVEDGYFALFKLPNAESLSVPIINLSAGGINVTMSKAAGNRIQEGDQILLVNIAGGRRLAFVTDIAAEVRWIKAVEGTSFVSAGCRFIDLPEPASRQLHQFIHSERMTRGQYD